MKNKKFNNNLNEKAVLYIKNLENLKKFEEDIKELSEFNQMILDNVPVSIIVINKQGVLTFVNKHFRYFSSSNSPLNRNVFRLPFFINEGLCGPLKKLLTDGTPFSKDNCRTVNSQGELKYLNIIHTPLKNDKGEITGALSMAIDNTEAFLYKKNLEDLNKSLERIVGERTRLLDDSNKQLKRALDLKLKFISDASHELRTPLTIIKGNLDVAIKYHATKDKEINEIRNIISHEVKRMIGVLVDLTLLTNADSDQEYLNYEKIDLNWKIKDALLSLKVLARHKNIAIKYKDSGPLEIMGDGSKIIKLLLNLLRNAIRYNKRNGWVKIWLEKDKDGVIIYIADSGIGIPEKDLPYIFERFYRVDKARSRDEGGTGLGLAICKWIVEAHKGTISVESKLGKGSTFIVRLPFDHEQISR